MNKNLRERQSEYEKEYNIILDEKYTWFCIRLDGKGFSKRIKKWKCNIPFDWDFHCAMCDGIKYLMKEIPAIKLGWTGSDEVTLLFKSSDEYYSNRINKLLSLTSSMMTYAFNKSMFITHENLLRIEIPEDKYDILEYGAFFDSRIITPPDLCECLNNFVYRQQDCIRNSISMWFSKFYSHKQTMKKNSDEKIQIMIDEQGFDWNTTPANWTKYGELFYYNKEQHIREEDNTEYFRNVIYCDSKKFTGTDLLKLLNIE